MAAQADYVRDAGHHGLILLPESASSIAASVDHVFYALMAASLLILLLIGGLIFYFSIRYRAAAEAPAPSSLSEKTSHLIEFGWTLPTLAVFLGIFYWAGTLYVDEYSPPADAEQVNVVAKQWMWKIQHENGAREIDEMHIPVGQRIRLHMTSQDVIHSFYIPAFRLKRDVLPGRYTSFWFKAVRPGTYSLFCAEFCGVDHSRMRGRVIAMAPVDYEAWLKRQATPGSAAAEGRRLFTSYGCSGCHATSSNVHAPPLAGIYGRQVHLADGRTATVNDGYIRDSILLPRRDVVAGYTPIMPSFKGQVSDADLQKLVAYVKSLSPPEDSP